MAAVLRFWPDLAVVTVEDSRRSKLLTGRYRELTTFLASLARSYVQIPLEICAEFVPIGVQGKASP